MLSFFVDPHKVGQSLHKEKIYLSFRQSISEGRQCFVDVFGLLENNASCSCFTDLALKYANIEEFQQSS